MIIVVIEAVLMIAVYLQWLILKMVILRMSRQVSVLIVELCLVPIRWEVLIRVVVDRWIAQRFGQVRLEAMWRCHLSIIKQVLRFCLFPFVLKIVVMFLSMCN